MVEAVRGLCSERLPPARCPSHTGSAATQPELSNLFGESVLALDVPPLVDGIDQGPFPPLCNSRPNSPRRPGSPPHLAAHERRVEGPTWSTCPRARHVGELIVAQRSMHSSVMGAWWLGGLQCHFVQPVIDVELGPRTGSRPNHWPMHWTRFPGIGGVRRVAELFRRGIGPSGPGRCRPLESLRPSRGRRLGSHFGFHPDLPQNAWRKGADIMISSTHKLGGSLTQSAMLHLGKAHSWICLSPL